MSVKLSTQKKPKDKKRKEPITYYELVELENQRNNPPPPKVKLIRKFPIAPDGFIPNSVVHKFFEMFEPDEQAAPVPIIWRLNWVRLRLLCEFRILDFNWFVVFLSRSRLI
jgi:hypothetical protein